MTNCSPVSCSQKASVSGQRPTRWKTSGEPQAGRPRRRTSPWLGRSCPAASFRNVDLPAPFGPRRPTTPGGIETVTSLRAMTGPYQREAPDERERRRRAGSPRARKRPREGRPRASRSRSRDDLHRAHAGAEDAPGTPSETSVSTRSGQPQKMSSCRSTTPKRATPSDWRSAWSDSSTASFRSNRVLEDPAAPSRGRRRARRRRGRPRGRLARGTRWRGRRGSRRGSPRGRRRRPRAAIQARLPLQEDLGGEREAPQGRAPAPGTRVTAEVQRERDEQLSRDVVALRERAREVDEDRPRPEVVRDQTRGAEDGEQDREADLARSGSSPKRRPSIGSTRPDLRQACDQI